jgi:hypothetical protein
LARDAVRQAIYDIRKWVTYGYDKVIEEAGAKARARCARVAADSASE